MPVGLKILRNNSKIAIEKSQGMDNLAAYT
jgi:hypothetical protein